MRKTYDRDTCRAADDLAALMRIQIAQVRAVLAQAGFGKEVDATVTIGSRLDDIRTACDQMARLLEIES